jgi:hypothetical protein
VDFEGYSFLIGLTLIPFSFILFPKLYFRKGLVVPLYIITMALAFIGWSAPHRDPTKPNFYLFLLCPIVSLLLLRLELFLFYRYIGRYPKYPPRNWSMANDRLWWDRAFYFTFVFLSICVPLFTLAVTYP